MYGNFVLYVLSFERLFVIVIFAQISLLFLISFFFLEMPKFHLKEGVDSINLLMCTY